MGNQGKNSNTSQFFITFGKLDKLNGKHVVFGEVVDGWEVLDMMEEVAGVGGGEAEDQPTVPVVIGACGVVGTPVAS
jgi:cyclophilin family peptidyl-prolyl cis-trans isomerase